MTTLDSPEVRTQLSSVWTCSCNAPIREVLISQQGVVAVATDSEVTLYPGAPSFGDSHSLSSSPSQLTALSFSADGTHFLTGDSSGFLKWWDVLKGDCTGATQFPLNKLDEADELSNSPPPICEIKCSQESELVAVSAGSTLCIYGDGGLLLHCIGPLLSKIQSMEWKTGEELAVNIGSAVCMITINPEDYTLGHQYPAELSQGSLSTLCCSPDGGMLAGGCSQGEVRIWDLASDRNGEISLFVKQFPNSGSGSSVNCMTWDSTGRFLAAAGDNDVIVWDMKDTTNEDGKDNSIVCYGHGQRAKIQAMKFQPNGGLLATGGDDCQLLVFDSKSFSSTGLVSGLVGCIGSGHVGQSQSPGSSITALAWHPFGLILAGTSTGRVDAFEVSSDLNKDRIPKSQNNRMNQQSGFLFAKGIPSKRANTQPPAGWGGEPLITKRNEDFSSEKFIRRPKLSGNMNNSQIRMTSGKPKVYQGKFKPNPRPYTERPPPPPPGGNPGTANWPSTGPMMIPPTMMHWPNYPQQLPPFMSPNPSPLSPYQSPKHPPHTPESASSEGNGRNGQRGVTGQNRNDRNFNRMAPTNHHHQNEGVSMTGPNAPHHAFSMGYLPYPTGHLLGYAPMPYGCYPVPTGVHPGPHPMPMTGMNPPTGDQHGIQVMNKSFQSMSVAPGGPTSIQQTQTGTQETPGRGGGDKGSPELDEELGSKSSEATNNGVNNGVTPGVEGLPPVDPDGRPAQGQTLYIGNLATGVEETLLMHYFSHYGPIVNAQVIRERDTHISRGFAFVTFAHPFCAQSAMRHMDSVQLPGPFEGRRLKVSFSNRR